MIPVIITWPALLGLAVLATSSGFGFGLYAMWRILRDEEPGQPFPLPWTAAPARDPGAVFELAGCWGPLPWGQLEREVTRETVPVAAVSARRGPARHAAGA